MSHCPTCKKSFDETEGFCPYDGSPLESSAPAKVRARSVRDDPSVLSELSANKKEEYDYLIGQTLDERYQIQEKLGEGGMGVVFLARHVVIEKPVAIKVLKRKVARDKNTVERFVQEARAASRIGHPNIIDVTDFGTTGEGLTYQVMEHLTGKTLRQLIKEGGALEIPRALKIALQIARALGAAHEKGIIHRDLKSDNVFLLDQDGRPDFVKIVDFGIAKVQPVDGAEAKRLTRAGSVFGTPEYMAPEQAAGRSDIDQRADIYALGIILYEMLVGQVPLRGDTPVRTIAMQMLDSVPPLRERRPDLDISPELEAVIMRAVEKKRDRRFADMKGLAHALDEAAGGIVLEPLAAGSSSSVRALSRQKGTHLEGPETEVDAYPPHGDELETVQPAGKPRKKPRPSTGDPAFVAASAAEPRYDRLDHPDTVPQVDAPARSRRWVIVGAVLLLCAFLGVGAALLSRRGSGQSAASGAGKGQSEAGKSGEPAESGSADNSGDSAGRAKTGEPGDDETGETSEGEKTGEAAGDVEGGGDSAVAGRRGGRHPGHGSGDRGEGTSKPLRPFHEVTILTRPEGGSLYVGHDYSGPDGTNLRRRLGTKVTVRCKKPGFKDGRVEVTFKRSREVYVCRLSRKKKCVEGLQNPFDDCPD